MAVAGFVFGLLSVAVFWWLGVTLGGIWAASLSVDAVIKGGDSFFATTPFWVLGLGIGVGLPVVSIVLSSVGLAKGESKGIGIVGVVTGAVGALLGLGFTLFSVFTLNLASAANELTAPPVSTKAEKEMQKTLDDPAFQEQIMKAMKAAAEKQQASSTSSEAANVVPSVPKEESPTAVPISSDQAETGGAGGTP